MGPPFQKIMSDHRFAAYDPDTREKIAAYRTQPDDALIGPILLGISRYYVPPEAEIPPDATPEQIFAVAATESLTLMEIILDVQDAFSVRFAEADLQRVHSMSDMVALIRDKR
jgi:acyl carrier protein